MENGIGKLSNKPCSRPELHRRLIRSLDGKDAGGSFTPIKLLEGKKIKNDKGTN